MEWVTTTGRTVEEAKEAALDELGVDASEAEFEVLEEPKTGLFGRLRTDARVRARVVPKVPRAKQERRPRKARARSGGGDRPKPEARAANPKSKPAPQENDQMTDDVVPVADQADIIEEFLRGLVAALGADGDVTRTVVDDDTIELRVEGDDLGLLIGPKGQTLTAIHELSRTVLQRKATGRHEGRVRIDIGGYRQRRAEALARFVTQQADRVRSEGASFSLEPMNAADRKVVHDTVNDIDGVSTTSEGIDPNRRVVLVPEAAEA